MKISVDKILPNPYRDFDTYPLDPDQVATLKASIEDTSFWGGLMFRKSPTQKGFFELACGHHRLEAAKQSGMSEIPTLKPPVDLSDDQMVDIMVRENLTQRGYNAAAIQDSVQANIRLLVRQHLGTNVPTSKMAETVKGQIEHGQGIGHKSVMAVMHGELSEREVREAIATIKATGKMATIISGVEAEFQAELKAAEEEAAKAKTAAAKKKADAKVKDLEQEAAAAAKAADATSEVATFDEKCVHLFPNMSQAESFRKVITSPGAMEYIPFSEQYSVASQILEKFGEVEDGKRNVTAVAIGRAVTKLVSDMRREDNRLSKIEREKEEIRNQRKEIRARVTELKAAITAIGSRASAVAKSLKKWKFDEDPLAIMPSLNDIDEAIKELNILRKIVAGQGEVK